jgi:hypothetical protein
MSSLGRSRSARGGFILVITSIAITSIAIVGLTACSNDGGPGPTPTATATATPGPDPASSANPKPTANPIVGTPIPLGCGGLVSAQTINNFGPSFVLKTDYAPKAGSQAATIVKQKGLACSWVNQSSGDTIDVAVAHLPNNDLTDLKDNLVQSSNPVPTYGDEAYFKVVDSMGTAEVFSGPFWIVASSKEFYEPGDATPIINAAIKNLGR